MRSDATAGSAAWASAYGLAGTPPPAGSRRPKPAPGGPPPGGLAPRGHPGGARNEERHTEAQRKAGAPPGPGTRRRQLLKVDAIGAFGLARRAGTQAEAHRGLAALGNRHDGRREEDVLGGLVDVRGGRLAPCKVVVMDRHRTRVVVVHLDLRREMIPDVVEPQ